MAVLTNNTPVTVTVGEVPLSAPFFESQNKMTPIWNKWLSSISTWITKSQEVKNGSFTLGDAIVGSYIAVRTGNIIVINGSINAGTYTNTTIMGIPVTPKVSVPVLLSGNIVDSGVILTDKTLNINLTSTAPILISATYIAVSSSENK